MSVWYCIPSGRPVAEVNARMAKWRAMGYKIALWRDAASDGFPSGYVRSDYPEADNFLVGTMYPGYAAATNILIRRIMFGSRTDEGLTVPPVDPDCDWVVCGGDDIDPDPTKTADEIARECGDYFENQTQVSFNYPHRYRTLGVMQPTGDRWGDNELHLGKTGSAYIDRICGSPWIGREFARRVNGGRGPWCQDYTHMFVDEHLQNVAERLGVLWQRRDLTQHHDHCRRDGVARTPEFLQQAYSSEHWKESKAIFERHKAAGFAESLRLID